MNVMTILNMILPFMFITVLNSLTVYISKRSFGKCLPLTLILSTFVMYFSQLLFHTFEIGFYLLILVFVLTLIIYRGEDNGLLKSLTGYGFIAFLVIYVIYSRIDYMREFNFWDELGHWGIMVKEMLRLDSFYAEPGAHLLRHKDYTPFIQVFQVLWCKLTGGYSEMGVSMAIHIFEFSVLIPCAFTSEKKDKAINHIYKAVFLFAVFALSILAFDKEWVVTSIYVDILMIALFVYAVNLVLTNEAYSSVFGFICFLAACTSLIFIKQIGVIYVVLSITFYFLLLPEKKSKKALVTCLLSVVSPAVIIATWKLYLSGKNVTGQFELGDIKIGELPGIISGRGGTDLQRETMALFIKRLYSGNLHNGFIYISYLLLAAILLLAVYLIFRYNKDLFTKKEAVSMGILFLSGTVIMVLVMAVLYMTSYSEEEMKVLVSFDRYMGTYLISELLIIYMELIIIFEKRGADVKEYMSEKAIIAGVLFLVVTLPSLVMYYGDAKEKDKYVETQSVGEFLNAKTEYDSDIFLISPYNLGSYYYFIQYYASERRIRGLEYEGMGITIPLGEESEKKMLDEVSECDYVFAISLGDELKEAFRKINGGRDLESNGLYKVDKNENGDVILRRFIHINEKENKEAE